MAQGILSPGLNEKARIGLGLFDLDGTLIAWDTQVLFCDFVLRKEGIRRAYLPLFLAFTPAVPILGDEGMKRIFLSYLLGMDPTRLRDYVEEFVALHFPASCFPELLQRLDAHRRAGHLTVLASASPEIWVREVGRVLGFDLVLGTQVEIHDKVGLFPDLTNHKGSEKVSRLSRLLPLEAHGRWHHSHGYSDSSADLPMLHCCDQATLVNPSSRLEGMGANMGWEVVRTSLPWNSPQEKARMILRKIIGL
jgi:HAD superfamily hydrolase (TIGR01490 family)